MVQTAINDLRLFQRDFTSIRKTTETFIIWAKTELISKEIDATIEEKFPEVRRRTVKTFFDEASVDEQPYTEIDKFRVNTFNVLIDTALNSMETRFSKNMDLCRDLAVLDPNNFEQIACDDSFESLSVCMESLSVKIIKYNSSATPENLKEELLNFAKNWNRFKLTIEDSYVMTRSSDFEELEIDVEEKSDDIFSSIKCMLCKNCALCCYSVILKYNMFQGAYSSLFTAYQYLLTLPIS